MSRRRYLSTEISTDSRINRLPDFAALLYTWMLPHFGDDCRISAKNAEELKMMVVPGRKQSIEQIQTAVYMIMEQGLLGQDEDGRYFVPDKIFYKYQTYINAEKRRETPQITSSLSPSPSPSPSLKRAPAPPTHVDARARGMYVDEFNRFWEEYPKKVGKGEAYKAWQKIRPSNGTGQAIIDAVKRQMNWYQWTREGGRYIPNPSTWLNQRRWEDEEVPAPLETKRETPADRTRQRTAEILQRGLDEPDDV